MRLRQLVGTGRRVWNREKAHGRGKHAGGKDARTVPDKKAGAGLEEGALANMGRFASYIEGAHAGGYAHKPGRHNISRPHGWLGDRRAAHSSTKRQTLRLGNWH